MGEAVAQVAPRVYERVLTLSCLELRAVMVML